MPSPAPTLITSRHTPEPANEPLRIGIIAPPWVAVPPVEYGGTELVIDLLARGLTNRGHDITLFTTGDATCPVRRRWVHPAAVGTTADLMAELSHVEAAYSEFADMDVIHDHTLLGLLWSRRSHAQTPVVTTVHGPFTPPLSALYEAVGADTSIVAISDHQRATAPSVAVDAVIPHGIDVEAFPVGSGKGGYLLFLGRMNPEKGVHRAIRVAREAGKRLIIAAKMWEPAEHRYFHEFVEPLLGDDVMYVGQVGGFRKLDLLGEAEALVNPIRWPEPFGLVMIEALATGTPVVSFAEGAAPEIVDHGNTGFICDNEVDMVQRVRAIDQIDRAVCRRAAETRFSLDRMVDDYIALYRRRASVLRHLSLTSEG